ncbi:hypothetical protein RFI_32902, partial [Reticulomyxa filosa]
YADTANGVFYLYQGIQVHISYRPFVILAFNALCNFVTIIQEVVNQILKGMAYHRRKDEGSCVNSAGCLALRNITADSKGQGAIGSDGVRLSVASVLHDLDTTLLLSVDQGIDLLVKILKKSDVDSVLFLNVLKVLTALLVKLSDDNLDGGNKKNRTVKYDNQKLQDICATILVVMAQTAPKLAKAIADAYSPAQLVYVGFLKHYIVYQLEFEKEIQEFINYNNEYRPVLKQFCVVIQVSINFLFFL